MFNSNQYGIKLHTNQRNLIDINSEQPIVAGYNINHQYNSNLLDISENNKQPLFQQSRVQILTDEHKRNFSNNLIKRNNIHNVGIDNKQNFSDNLFEQQLPNSQDIRKSFKYVKKENKQSNQIGRHQSSKNNQLFEYTAQNKKENFTNDLLNKNNKRQQSYERKQFGKRVKFDQNEASQQSIIQNLKEDSQFVPSKNESLQNTYLNINQQNSVFSFRNSQHGDINLSEHLINGGLDKLGTKEKMIKQLSQELQIFKNKYKIRQTNNQHNQFEDRRQNKSFNKIAQIFSQFSSIKSIINSFHQYIFDIEQYKLKLYEQVARQRQQRKIIEQNYKQSMKKLDQQICIYEQKLSQSIKDNKKLKVIINQKSLTIEQLQARIFILQQQDSYNAKIEQSNRISNQIKTIRSIPRSIQVESTTSLQQSLDRPTSRSIIDNLDSTTTLKTRKLYETSPNYHSTLNCSQSTQNLEKQRNLNHKQNQLRQKQRTLLHKQQTLSNFQTKLQSDLRKMDLKQNTLSLQYEQILTKYKQIKKQQSKSPSKGQYGLRYQSIRIRHPQTIMRSERSRSNSLQVEKIVAKLRNAGSISKYHSRPQTHKDRQYKVDIKPRIGYEHNLLGSQNDIKLKKIQQKVRRIKQQIMK